MTHTFFSVQLAACIITNIHNIISLPTSHDLLYIVNKRMHIHIYIITIFKSSSMLAYFSMCLYISVSVYACFCICFCKCFCINYIPEPGINSDRLDKSGHFESAKVVQIFYWLHLTQIRFLQSSMNSIHHMEFDPFKLDLGHYCVCF